MDENESTKDAVEREKKKIVVENLEYCPTSMIHLFVWLEFAWGNYFCLIILF